MEKLVTELTQKDEHKARLAAELIINNKDIDSFKELCSKSDFLFDFVITNVQKRISHAINEHNYRNLLAFFSVYDETFADCIIKNLVKYADEDLTDEIYNLLENGSNSQKAYAAKYFSYIPDTIALEKLEEYAFCDDTNISYNTAQALSSMEDSKIYKKALDKLNDVDDFEAIKAVKFLTKYGNKSAVKNILEKMENSSLSENIAGELPYLMRLPEIFETQKTEQALSCLDYILLGFGEILPISAIFDYELYDIIQNLISEKTQSSQKAVVLLRALDKFSTLTENEEYIFDETKETKQEVYAIANLLKQKNHDYWEQQKQLVTEELKQSTNRITNALEIIRIFKIVSAKSEIENLAHTTHNEQLLVQILGICKTLDIISDFNQTEILDKINDTTLKAVASSYFF